MSIFDDFPRGRPEGDGRDAPLGTARWRRDAPRWKEGDLWLGRDDDKNLVGHGDDRHIVTIAGSRSGKGRSGIIPNLMMWPGSCVVIDPKGENATRTASIRAMRRDHKVVVIDPRGAADVPDDMRVGFNPLDLIDDEDENAIDLAAAIGDALMIDSGDGKDIHWTESARQIFEAVLLHVAVSEVGARRSLVRVRQLLTIGDRQYADLIDEWPGEEDEAHEKPSKTSPFEALWTQMTHSPASQRAVRDVIAGAANSVQEMGENERGSVLSTARRNTKFIDSPWMRKCLESASTFTIDDLKSAKGGVTVYICLPARFIPTHARFLRLMLNLILYRMETQGLDQPACGHPVLFVLDEFAALGKMESIEKAAGLMAGFGVKLWPILQDLGQIKRHYRESWETFLGNAGLLQFFANADMTTLEWLSKRLGQAELIRETGGRSTATTTQMSKSQSQSESAGWSEANGTSQGVSEMPDLSRIAARDGGSSMLPFLARSNASGTGHSEGTTNQKSVSGSESIQRGDSSSSGSSETVTNNEGIHRTPLLNPDEIARLFDRKSGRQIVFIDGENVALYRTNYDEDSFLRDRSAG